MTEKALSEQIHQLEQEIRLGGEETDRKFLEMRAEIDRLRLKMTALKNFLATAVPDFEERFPEILSRTIQEFDPETD